MKTRSKALVLTLCAVLLVVATVMGTMAYLTSTDTVTNTFTVGKVAITLDEAKVNPNGTLVYENDGTTPVARVRANEYKLIPGHSYTKDPTVHVTAGSENSYIFVKVENGIAAYEAATEAAEGGYKNIADQITANHWTALTDVANVYYKEYNSNTAQVDMEVFKNFKIADNANDADTWNGITAENTKITVTAYAVQKDGFANAKAAWDATFGAPVTP